MTGVDEQPAGKGIRRASPVRQVLTLFGDYWWHVDEGLPTGALVAVLGDLGLKEAAARATLTRMVRNGLLSAERSGRRTAHRLTERASAIVDEEAEWLDTFGVEEQPWDGLWSVLAFSIPESRRAVRHLARSRLRWLGFMPLYDGVWISPRNHAADAMAQLRDLDVRDVTSMRASVETSIAGGPQTAWDLASIADEYRSFAAAVGAVDPSAPPAAALAERTRLMLRWQAFRLLDNAIPRELVPEDWPRTATRTQWVGHYNAMGAPAEQRVRAEIAPISAELAERVTARRLRA